MPERGLLKQEQPDNKMLDKRWATDMGSRKERQNLRKYTEMGAIFLAHRQKNSQLPHISLCNTA